MSEVDKSIMMLARPPPAIVFLEDNVELTNENVKFPNLFHLLQCFTLKSASDSFDLERYEILGDCFLKLTVVLKIFSDFKEVQEGKMSKLKSMRVSNQYLFKLAVQKKLSDYIISRNCSQRENCVGPWTHPKDKILTVLLGDKSLADCVEALLGCYLINLGSRAAKVFLEWLEYVISDQAGVADFITQPLSDADTYSSTPKIIAPKVTQEFEQLLIHRYADFETKLGYKFRNRAYLYEAFTHPSDISNSRTSSYQK